MKRRQFLHHTLILGASVYTGLCVRSFHPDHWAAELTHFFRHPNSARHVGQAYLRLNPEEADLSHLLEILGANTAQPPLRPMLLAQLRQDFEAGRMVNVQGWMLAQTEARLCAVAALLEGDRA